MATDGKPINPKKPEEENNTGTPNAFGGFGGGFGAFLGPLMAIIQTFMSIFSGGGIFSKLFGGLGNNQDSNTDPQGTTPPISQKYGNSIDALAKKNTYRNSLDIRAGVKPADDVEPAPAQQTLGRRSTRIIVTPELRERQEQVLSALPAAAKSAGISKDMMVAVWGVESKYSSDLRSPTGCLGPWQFERKSLVDRVAVDGQKIIADLKANGFVDSAARVQTLYDNVKDLPQSKRASYIRNNAGIIDELRMDSAASTFAAAHHLKESAQILKVDPNNPRHFGIIYAGYNVGPNDAAKMLRGEWVDNQNTRNNRHVALDMARREGSQHKAYDRFIGDSLTDRRSVTMMARLENKNNGTENDNVRLAQTNRTGATIDSTPSLRSSAEPHQVSSAIPDNDRRPAVAALSSPAPSIA